MYFSLFSRDFFAADDGLDHFRFLFPYTYVDVHQRVRRFTPHYMQTRLGNFVDRFATYTDLLNIQSIINISKL